MSGQLRPTVEKLILSKMLCAKGAYILIAKSRQYRTRPDADEGIMSCARGAYILIAESRPDRTRLDVNHNQSISS